MKFTINVTVKESGEKYNTIIGNFDDKEAADKWAENQSRGILQYDVVDPEDWITFWIESSNTE